MIEKSPDTPAAVLFDIDGTLVDSNYVHVLAWMHGFAKVERHVDAWRIHAAIGMDGKKLLEELLGSEADTLGDAAKQEHTYRYKQLGSLLAPFDKARELLRELSARGIKVVLATSAPPNELEMLRDLLDVEDAIEAVTNAEDVETAKPQPDIVSVALERAGVDAADAVFVGDAVWDIKAANAAGVICVGVNTGGTNANKLREAGAAATYDSVGALLDGLNDSLLVRRQ